MICDEVTFAESLIESKYTGTSVLSLDTSQAPVWFILFEHPVRARADATIQTKLLIIGFNFLSDKVCDTIEKVLCKIIYFDSAVNAPLIIGCTVSRADK